MKSCIKIAWGETEISFTYTTLLVLLVSLLMGSSVSVFISDFHLPVLIPMESASFVKLLLGNFFCVGLFLFAGFIVSASIFGTFAIPAVVFILGYQVSGGLLEFMNLFGTKNALCFIVPWTVVAGVLVLYNGFCFDISRNIFIERRDTKGAGADCSALSLRVFIIGTVAGLAAVLIGSSFEHLFLSLLL